MLNNFVQSWLALGIIAETVLSAPAGPPGRPQGAPILVQSGNNRTRHFALGGALISFDPAGDATSSSGVSSTTPAQSSSTRPNGAGLIAAEVSEVVDGSILVQYYQEKNSRAPSTAYQTPPPAPPAAQPSLTHALPPTDEAGKWVDLHNRARELFGAGKLEWRDDLVARAKANADLCTGDHSNAGENIAAQSGSLTPELTVEWWMAEEVFYDWSKPAFEDKTGHFTQAVWKNSRFVGCYTTKCNPGTVFEASYGVSYQSTCEYDPVGNYVNPGEFAKNVGKRESGTAPWRP